MQILHRRGIHCKIGIRILESILTLIEAFSAV